MIYSIDIISGDKAFLMADDGTIIEVSLQAISGNAKEGDVVIEHNGQYTVDEKETENRRKQIQQLLNELLHSEKE